MSIMPYDRIIDRDIEFYTASVEHEVSTLHRCHASNEEYHRRRLFAAKDVLKALEEYRRAMGTYPADTAGKVGLL